MISSKRILYLTHRVPYPPDKGDRIRTYNVLRSLAQHHEVDLLALADEPVADATIEKLQELCHQVCIVPLSMSFRRTRMAWSILTGGSATLTAFHSFRAKQIISKWMQTHRYDVLLASSSAVAPYVTENTPSTFTIIDLVDVDSEKWFNYASTASWYKQWVYQREGNALRRYELSLARRKIPITLVSEAETDLFRKLAPCADIHTVSNGVDLGYFHSNVPVPSNTNCVFVGAMDYHPNIDGICWFARHIWPAVREKYPFATINIVGRKPDPSVTLLGKIPGITVVGQVSDVRPFVTSAQAVVIPLRIARGLQNKALEALAMSRPVIASSPALAGLTSIEECPALRADEQSHWLCHFDQLFNDSNVCHLLAQQGRKYVEKHYTWEECLQPLHELIEDTATPRIYQQHADCESSSIA
jgi:sugar transferase (PEP-CTERM/EpsH1 system associated)